MILPHARSIYPADAGWKLIPAWAATWTILAMSTQRGGGRRRPTYIVSPYASDFFTEFVPFVLSLSMMVRCLVGMGCLRILTCSVPAVSRMAAWLSVTILRS